eukprot:4411183-Prymnesium_polylepis.1
MPCEHAFAEPPRVCRAPMRSLHRKSKLFALQTLAYANMHLSAISPARLPIRLYIQVPRSLVRS